MRSAARYFRQQYRGEQTDNGKNANDFDKGEAALPGPAFSAPN